jgi:SAM-dependent methyltransferase
MTSSPESPRTTYQEKGFYLHPEPVPPPALLRQALDRIPALVREEYDTGVPPWRRYNVGDPHKMQKIDQVHLCDRAFHALATHPVLGEWVAAVTGADAVQIWATQLFLKPPRGGDLGAIGWHTDRDNWRFWEGEVATVWLALEEFGPDSGPVLYVEGSHLWPDSEKQGDAYAQDLEELEQRMKAQGPERPWRKVPVLVKAGGFGLHSADILHGSGPNRTDSPRVGLGINVRTNRARPRAGVEDFGYTSFLNHPFVAPTIYVREGGSAGSVPWAIGGASPQQIGKGGKEAVAGEGAGQIGGAGPDAGAGQTAKGGAESASRGFASGAAGAASGERESGAPARAADLAARLEKQTAGRGAAMVTPLLRRGMRVLDAGCGAGAVTTMLARLLSPGVAVGIDIDAGQVERARAALRGMGLANVEIHAADVCRLPFEEGSFDGVVSNGLLSRLSDPGAAVKELHRVCKPGGFFAARERLAMFDGLPAAGGAERRISEVLRELGWPGGAPETGMKLKGLLASAGFQRIQPGTYVELFDEVEDLDMLLCWVSSKLLGPRGERAVEEGRITREELADLASKVRDWASAPGAICVVPWIEVIAWKPA